MFNLTKLFSSSQGLYSPPPNPDKPLSRKPAYRGGKIYRITVRSTPKINRKRELKERKQALRKWKRERGISGRVSSESFAAFKGELQNR